MLARGALVLALALAVPACGSDEHAQADGHAHEHDVSAPSLPIATRGTRILEAPDGSVEIKVLLDASNLGSDEVELGEIEFPPGYHSQGHSHDSTELFYVLSGALEHIVNGRSSVVGPGEVAIVRPGDEVSHAVHGDEPCRLLVVWVPGGEVARLSGFIPKAIRPLE